MDRRTRNLFALVLVATIVLTGGAALILGGSPVPAPSSPPATDDVVGVIVGVESEGLGDVRGFTLRQAGGALLAFTLDELTNPTEFPPGHLAEHQATAETVRVWYRERDGTLVAIRLEDAGP